MTKNLQLLVNLMVGVASFFALERLVWSEQPVIVSAQPLISQVHRVAEALEVVGAPLNEREMELWSQIRVLEDDAEVTKRVQKLLDRRCLAYVDIQDKGAPRVAAGPATARLLEQGWRTFLVKVVNRPGRTGRLLVESPNAQPLPHSPADQVASRWMQISSFEGQPLRPNLSGLPLEYRIIQIYSRNSGTKSSVLEFNISGGPDDDRELIRQWRFNEDADGWHAMNQIELKHERESLWINSTGDDPFMGAEVSSRGGPMILRFWAHTETEGIGQFFWWTEDRPEATADRQTNFILEPGKEHLYEIPFFVDGNLKGIRLDPLVKPGKMRLDWVDLYSANRSDNWAKLPLEFDVVPATTVRFRIADLDGTPGFGRFEIRDTEGRIYPAQSKRLAPDFFFQRHIYRGDGETISLPAGKYSIVCSRGPETFPEQKTLVVTDKPTELAYKVQRWIDPAAMGWWSGDHHIHAAGCLHYQLPTEGVEPEDMIRHTMGEDLKVGCCLTWGPCFDYQKRFFTGAESETSRYPYILRYDVEVSGFGSHMSGHLNLLNLSQQIYPGGESKDHWPTLGLSTLRWAKRQGAVCGPAHSAIGLMTTVGRLPGTEGKDGPNRLPNFDIPAYDGIGANEFIMNVTHEVPGSDGSLVPAVDFISTMNTPRVEEWNMWYHVLNAGFRISASGETDFPCMSGERVGIGRVYAQVDGRLTFDKWIKSISQGRSYVSDGYCHLLNFKATAPHLNETVQMGIGGSELKSDGPVTVNFDLTAAARYTTTDTMDVELIVNGYPVSSKTLKTDGLKKDLSFQYTLTESSWAAVRVFPNAHTNPIYVVINDKPIVGSVDSVRWCLAGLEQCWKAKQPTYAKAEQADARAAYNHARNVYKNMLNQAQR